MSGTIGCQAVRMSTCQDASMSGCHVWVAEAGTLATPRPKVRRWLEGSVLGAMGAVLICSTDSMGPIAMLPRYCYQARGSTRRKCCARRKRWGFQNAMASEHRAVVLGGGSGDLSLSGRPQQRSLRLLQTTSLVTGVHLDRDRM